MKAQVFTVRAAALVVAAHTAHAQTGTIAGMIKDERSGAPFVGVLAAVDAPEHYGRYSSNFLGIYRLRDVRAGDWTVEFHCPSANDVGREILTRPVTVRAGETTIIDVEVPDGHCLEPPYSERRSEFRGYLAFGFESSRFEPCEAEALNLSKNIFFEENRIWAELPASAESLLQQDTQYYIEASGTLRGPGTYGHLGGSEYELQIDAINVAFEVEEKDCGRDLGRGGNR